MDVCNFIPSTLKKGMEALIKQPSEKDFIKLSDNQINVLRKLSEKFIFSWNMNANQTFTEAL